MVACGGCALIYVSTRGLRVGVGVRSSAGGVSRWEKSFFAGVGRVEDGALAALGHLVMSSIVISLRRALRVIAVSVVARWPVWASLVAFLCQFVAQAAVLCLGFSPLGGHVVDEGLSVRERVVGSFPTRRFIFGGGFGLCGAPAGRSPYSQGGRK